MLRPKIEVGGGVNWFVPGPLSQTLCGPQSAVMLIPFHKWVRGMSLISLYNTHIHWPYPFGRSTPNRFGLVWSAGWSLSVIQHSGRAYTIWGNAFGKFDAWAQGEILGTMVCVCSKYPGLRQCRDGCMHIVQNLQYSTQCTPCTTLTRYGVPTIIIPSGSFCDPAVDH